MLTETRASEYEGQKKKESEETHDWGNNFYGPPTGRFVRRTEHCFHSHRRGTTIEGELRFNPFYVSFKLSRELRSTRKQLPKDLLGSTILPGSERRWNEKKFLGYSGS